MKISGLEMFFDPVVPAPFVLLLGLLLSALTIWSALRTASRLSAVRQATLFILRFCGIMAALLLLLQPSRIEKIAAPIQEKLTIVAVDTSASMRQADAEKLSRFDSARNLLWDAGILPSQGKPAMKDVRLFEFSENASPVTKPLNELTASGSTTRFDDSVRTMLGSLGPAQGADAIFLLSDGHDFQLTSPSQTGLAARMRQVPIYAVPFGGAGLVRDVSVRITSYQPIHYIRQLIRLNASIRLLGCSYEKLNVTLYREGKPIQRTSVLSREETSLPVQFETTEPEPGQYEYEIKVDPVAGEANPENNSTATYANVLDKKIRVLLLEGEPYWDTTFLMRSLRRNNKLDLDSVAQYAPGKVRVIRTGDDTSMSPFKMPESAADWSAYDVVIFGRGLDKVLTGPQVEGFLTFVEKLSGAVVFSRADAFSGGMGDSLQPVAWKKAFGSSIGIVAAKEGRTIPPTRLLNEAASRADGLPAMIGFYDSSDRKALTATLASSASSELPVILHRRHGAGQVMSVGVDGLWRWAFNAKSDPAVPLFDKFWDQTILWLMSGRSLNPGQEYTLRADTGNVLLGSKIRFRIISRKGDSRIPPVPLKIERERTETGRVTCTGDGSEGAPLTGEFLPQQTGRYVAGAQLPDGTTQTVRFYVYDDNEEETDVVADPSYLRRLCEASGGRVIRADEFQSTFTAMKEAPLENTPRTRKVALWDRLPVFWAIGLMFGMEWYLRRRWGLC